MRQGQGRRSATAGLVPNRTPNKTKLPAAEVGVSDVTICPRWGTGWIQVRETTRRCGEAPEHDTWRVPALGYVDFGDELKCNELVMQPAQPCDVVDLQSAFSWKMVAATWMDPEDRQTDHGTRNGTSHESSNNLQATDRHLMPSPSIQPIYQQHLFRALLPQM